MKTRTAGDGYRPSQICPNNAEECFGWLRTVAGLGRVRAVGKWRPQQIPEVGLAAFNTPRLRTLKPA